jgi:hypothetical protein
VPLVTVAESAALDALNNVAPSVNYIGWASLHSTYSATGANELTGGSPAYARVGASGGGPLSWSSASAGSKALAATPAVFNVPGGSPVPQQVAFVGLWSLQSGGVFGGMGANGGFPAYGFTAATSGNTFTAPGSSYSNGQQVVLWAGQGATTPGGFTVGTISYVISASGAQFSLSATLAGGAVTVSAAGSGLVQAIAVEQYAAQGNFTLSQETLSVLS